jgi:serine/threonine-protein kinase
MGVVYEGRHLEIGKRLAIKLIHPQFCGSAQAVARFRREARAASAVESDYIVQIYDFGRDDSLGLYMVMEYLDGQDLEARLQRERWIDTRAAATIGLQVARGLARAHAAGIIHRDLKPANIFLSRRDDGTVHAKLLDFGISKLEIDRGAPDAAEPTLTAYGTTLGTPQYMSPEQCLGDVAVDARTDIWSLCAVLYEMIAGEPAISAAGGYIQMMRRIVREDVVPLEKRASWVQRDLARVIDAGLVRSRAQRLPSAFELATRLVDAFPDAGSRPSITAAVAKRSVDIAAVRPAEVQDTPLRVQLAARSAAAGSAAPVPPPTASAAATLVDVAKPSPSSQAPASSDDQSVAIFARDAVPRELVMLRGKRER